MFISRFASVSFYHPLAAEHTHKETNYIFLFED